MARPWVRKRKRKDGSVSLNVQWRDPRGQIQSLTFGPEPEGYAVQKKKVERFIGRVMACGDEWPPEYNLVHTPRLDPNGLTVRQAVLDYIPTAKKANASTKAEYRRMTDRYLAQGSYFAGLAVGRVTPRDCTRWLGDMAGAEPGPHETPGTLSVKTQRNMHALVSAAFRRLVEDEALRSNPALGLAPEGGFQPIQHVLKPDEFWALLEFVPEHFRPLVLTLVLTGARWGEATALQVRHVDLNTKVVEIKQAWKATAKRGVLVAGPPKSKKGVRAVGISDFLAETLTPLVRARPRNDWLFVTASGNVIRHGNFHSRIWRPAALAAHESGDVAFVPRIHDLRHASASWLLEAGEPVSRVAKRLGHDPVVLLRTYSHVMDPESHQSAAALDAVLGSRADLAVKPVHAPPRKSRAKIKPDPAST